MGFNRFSLATDPKIVSAKATLSYLMELTTGLFQTDDYITFSLPSGYFEESTELSACTSNTEGITVTSCVTTKNQVVLTIAVTIDIKIFRLTLNNYYNPYSTTPVTGIKTWLRDAVGNLRGYYQSSIESLEADELPAATLTPLSEVVGAVRVSHRWSIRLKNTIFADSIIQIYYPEWNPEQGEDAFKMISSLIPKCTPVTNTVATMTCRFVRSSGLLRVEKAIGSEVAGGSLIEFEVDSFSNPYSGKPRSGFWVKTTDSKGGEIDSSLKSNLLIQFKVTQFTDFQNLILTRVDTQNIVGELSVGQIEFTLELPTDANCRLEIRFPSDMPLTVAMQKVDASGIITGTQIPPTLVDYEANTFFLDGCESYSTFTQGTIIMYYMKNKGHVMDTFSFAVTLWALNTNDNLYYPIAKRKTDTYFRQDQFTTGSITKFTLDTVESNEVQSHTRYSLHLWPVHDMPSSSKITVRFPYDMNLTEGSCDVEDPLAPMTLEGLCNVEKNLITIRNPFGLQTFTANPNGLRFNFSSGGENPLSEKDSGTYYVDTYAIVDKVPYHIDTNYFTSVFKPVRGTIRMKVHQISSYQTYDAPMNYTFEINPTKKMPEKSIFTIEIPPVITVLTNAVPRCTYSVKGGNMTSTVMETLEVSVPPIVQEIEMQQNLKEKLAPRTIIKISDMLLNRWYLDPGTPFYVTCEGFRNPRTTRETATFKIYSTDQDNYFLEEKLTDITTQMLTRPNMTNFEVQISNYINGDKNTYNITTSSPLPHFTGDILQFEFPIEVRLKSTVECVALDPLVMTNIECWRVGDFMVRGKMTFFSDYIGVDTTIKFQVLQVQNPPDTRKSSPFKNVIITDPLGYQLTQYVNITTIQTLSFATVQNKSLEQSNKGLLLNSYYIFTYTTVNRMPSGSSFLIYYPRTVQPPVVLPTCNINYKERTFKLFSCDVDLQNNVISVSGGFTTEVNAGDDLVIVLGPITTPITQLNPGNFILESYVGNTYIYKIDEITEGLVPLFECDHPCRTCQLPERQECLSCQTNNPVEKLIFLEDRRCTLKCPDGKFGNIRNDKICEFCPTECLTCFNELTCTRCKQNSNLPDLYNNWCNSNCPANYCPINFKCVPCTGLTFSTLSVIPNPSTVGLKSQVELTASIPSLSATKFEQNDILWLLIPDPGLFIISNDTSELWRYKLFQDYFSNVSLCQSNTNGISVEYCTIYKSRVMMKLSVTAPSIKSAVFRIGNFQNPSTTTPIPKIKTFLTMADDTPKVYFTETVMINLEPEKMNIASISPSSFVIGARSLLLTVKFRNLNKIETDQQIWVRFPFWNPRSPTPLHMITSLTPNCRGVTILKTVLTCRYDQASRTLKVTNPVSATLLDPSDIEFTVDSFQNPFNSIQKTGFQIATMEKTGTGKMDESSILSITVTEFAVLEQPLVTRADTVTTVGELSSLTFAFQINLPVDPDCRLRVTFPQDQPLTTDLQRSTGTNLFSSAFGFSAFSLDSNYVEIAGCATYSESQIADQTSLITVSNIKNIGWVKDTQPFKFEFFAVSRGTNYNIARVQTSTMIVRASMLTRGPILILQIAALDNQQASQQTRFKITIRPVHGIPPQNKIKVKFPTVKNRIELEQSDINSCTVTSQEIAITNAKCEVDLARNEVVAIDLFGGSAFEKDGPAFSFSVSARGRNPDRACGFIKFEAATFAVIDGSEFAIDYQSFDSENDFPPRFDPFMPKPDILIAAIAKISSTVASYKPVTYFFTVTPMQAIPQGGYLQVWMPRSVRLPLGVNQINCTIVRGTQKFYEYATPSSVEPLRFDLQNFVKDAPSPAGTRFTLQCDGIWNPRTLTNTESIELSTRDLERCAIELADRNLKVDMTQLPSFESVIIQKDNYINGGYATYSFEYVPRFILYNDDYLKLTFPPEITLPAQPECEGGNLLRTIRCTVVGQNELKVEFSFKTAVLAESYRFSFRVFNVRNSPNTSPTGPFTNLQALDASNRPIQNYLQQGPQMTNQEAAIAHGSLQQDSNEPGAITQYTITYRTINRMAQGFALLIGYPKTVEVPRDLMNKEGELEVCSVQYLGQTYQMKCQVNMEAHQILVRAADPDLTINVPDDTEIKVRLGRIRNPLTPLSVSGFTLASYTDARLLYIIDRVIDNLVPQHQCEYPCATCTSMAERSKCLSCFTTEVPRYYYNYKCLPECPHPLVPNQLYQCVGPVIEFEVRALSASNYLADNEPTKYSLEIHPTKRVPDGSVIKIEFPRELRLASGATNIVCDTKAQMSQSQIFNNTGKVTLTSAVPPLAITIEGLFLSRAIFDLGSKVTVTCDQIKNPPTIQASGSFTVSISHPTATTYTLSTGMSVTMRTLPTFTSFKIEPLGNTAGTIGEYRFTIKSGQQLRTGTKLKVAIPQELTLPDAIICSLISTNLQSISCTQEYTCINKAYANAADMKTVPTGTIVAQFTFLNSPIPQNEDIVFAISNILNPQSTKPVEMVRSVELYDQANTLIPEINDKTPIFSMQLPAQVVSKSLTLDTYERGAKTGFTLTYTTKNKMEPKTLIVIGYPLTANFQGGIDILCGVTVNGVAYAHQCKLDRIRREITFSITSPAGVAVDKGTIPLGASISLIVKEFKNEAPRMGLSTDQFTLNTYLDKSRVYGIDQIRSGLTLYSCEAGTYPGTEVCLDCVMPCQSCAPPGTLCESCYAMPASQLYENDCCHIIDCPVVI